MKAEVTYNAGKSYRIKGTKFEQGKTKVVTDAATIKKCQMTAGFSVRVLEAAKPPKKKAKSRRIREVEKPAAKEAKTTTAKKKDKDKSTKADK